MLIYHRNATTILILSIAFFLFFSISFSEEKFSSDAPSVNVLKTVGINGDFTTIRQAFDSVNAGVFSNLLVLSLLDSAYFESTLILSPAGTAPSSIILKPAGNFIPHITISQSNANDPSAVFIQDIPQVIFLNLQLEVQNALWNSALYISSGVAVVRLDTISLNGGTAITGINAGSDDSLALIIRASNISNVKSGISVSGWTAFTLLHSEIIHSEGTGIFLEIEIGRVRIVGNTLNGNDGADAGIVGSVYSPFCVIDSNTISNYQISGMVFEDVDGSEIISGTLSRNISFNAQQSLKNLKTSVAKSFSVQRSSRSERLQHFKARKKRLQTHKRKQFSAFSLFAVRNNTVSFLTGDAGISALNVYGSAVDISHNSITNQYGAEVGVYCESLDEIPSVTIEYNFVRNVTEGIFIDYIYTSEDVGRGTVDIRSNNIESGANGLYLGDVICSRASLSMNTVRAATEKKREQNYFHQQKIFVGDIGIFIEMEGVLNTDSNFVEGYARAFELYSELLTSISGNTIRETENAIELYYDIYSDSLRIDNNTISRFLGTTNIFLSTFESENPQGRLSISGNSLDNENASEIEVAIIVEYAYCHSFTMENNSIINNAGGGILVGEFVGYYATNSRRLHHKQRSKEHRSSIREHNEKFSALQKNKKQNRLQRMENRKHEKQQETRRSSSGQLLFPTNSFSFKNNAIELRQNDYRATYGFDCEYIEFASVDISSNKITSETAAEHAMYIQSIVNGYKTLVEQNNVQQVMDGISFFSIEFIEGYEEPTELSVTRNNIETFSVDGLYFTDIYTPTEIHINANVVKGIVTSTSNLNNGIFFSGENGNVFILDSNVADNFSTGFNIEATTSNGIITRNFSSNNIEYGMFFDISEVAPMLTAQFIFEKNYVAHNETGAYFFFYVTSMLPVLRENIFVSNSFFGVFLEGNKGIVQSNVFNFNDEYDLKNNRLYPVNAEYNWWGPTTTAEMNSNPYPSNISAIYDSFDNSSKGFVKYKNWLQDSVTTPRGIILGNAFEDYRGNGLSDDDDIIENRKIILSGTSNETTYTDEFGSYSFTNLLPGTYYVYQILPNTWVQTLPDSLYTIVIDSNEIEFGKSFGSFKLGSASGIVFNDKNGNGVQDSNEEFLENWKVKLSGGKNDSAGTNQYGEYKFFNLFAGSYTIHLNLFSGWIPTFPQTATRNVFIKSGDSFASLHFGVRQPGKISGYVFNDADSNGVRDSNEVGLSEWKVFLLGTKTDSITTNSFGYYEFDRLFLGTYTVRERVKPQWIQSSPPMNVYQITIGDELIHENKNFGNYLTPSEVNERISALRFSLSQNYPNPFNPVTHFPFSLESKEFVSLKIFNLIGEEVATLLSKELPAGTYSVEWNANEYPNGIYFYRLHAGKFIETKKLILQK
jgi:hypothetical protein